MQKKKILYISLISLDAILTLFFFVISLIMIIKTTTMTPAEIQSAENKATFIGYLQNNPMVYGLGFVVPLFLLLAANVIFLVIYMKKTNKKEQVKVNDLSAEQKEALRQELLKDLQKTDNK